MIKDSNQQPKKDSLPIGRQLGLTLGLAGCAGILLGGILLGGLWWTVRNGITAERSGLWFFGSVIVRMAIVIAGFYFVTKNCSMLSLDLKR